MTRSRTPIRPDWQAAILGAALLCAVIVTAAISDIALRSSSRAARHAIVDLYPARDNLLFIDRDLYQAQMALERAARSDEPEERDGQLAVYEENVLQTQQRFEDYRDWTADLSQGTHVPIYLGYRQSWLEASQRLLGAMTSGAPPEDIEPLIEQTAASFGEMRFALDRITEGVMNPLIQRSAAEIESQARDTRRAMLATAIVALILGASITFSGVLGIRRQHQEMVAERDERDRESRRKDFEQRVHNAFDLVKTEESALRVVQDVLTDIVSPGEESEMLMADSSRAHLRRAAATAETSSRGCKVLEPNDCPAIRRNMQLAFARDDGFDVCPYLKDRSQDGCSALCIPINVLGGTAGVIHSTVPLGDHPQPERELRLRTLAAEAGTVVGMLRAFETKERQANTDSLTGLPNRRSLEEQMRAVASRGDYTVAFGDLDFFKRLNDTHGHDTGDKALRLFADVLRASLRPDDLAARWGGEEFVVVLPGCADKKAIFVLERIRDRLREMLALGALPQFTVSFGVSDSRNAESFDEVVGAADKALLRAKNEGRDRIIYGIAHEEDERLGDEMLTDPSKDTGIYRSVAG